MCVYIYVCVCMSLCVYLGRSWKIGEVTSSPEGLYWADLVQSVKGCTCNSLSNRLKMLRYGYQNLQDRHTQPSKQSCLSPTGMNDERCLSLVPTAQGKAAWTRKGPCLTRARLPRRSSPLESSTLRLIPPLTRPPLTASPSTHTMTHRTHTKHTQHKTYTHNETLKEH